jgi:hypothetical protein
MSVRWYDMGLVPTQAYRLAEALTSTPDGAIAQDLYRWTRKLVISGQVDIRYGRTAVQAICSFACKLQKLHIDSIAVDPIFLALLRLQHGASLVDLQIRICLDHSACILWLEGLHVVRTLRLTVDSVGNTGTLRPFGVGTPGAFENIIHLDFRMGRCYDDVQGNSIMDCFSRSRFPALLTLALLINNVYQSDLWSERIFAFLRVHSIKSLRLTLSVRLLDLVLPSLSVEEVHVTSFNGAIPIGTRLSPFIRYFTLGVFTRGFSPQGEYSYTRKIFLNIYRRVAAAELLALEVFKLEMFSWTEDDDNDNYDNHPDDEQLDHARFTTMVNSCAHSLKSFGIHVVDGHNRDLFNNIYNVRFAALVS